MKISSVKIEKRQFSTSYPVVFLPSGIKFANNVSLITPSSLTGNPGGQQVVTGEIRYVHIQKSIVGKALIMDQASKSGSEFGCRIIVRPRSLRYQRNGKGGNPHKGGFHGRSNRSGIGNVIPQISPAVYAGDNNIRFKGKEIVNTQVDAVSRSSINSENTRAQLQGPEGVVKRQGMSDSTPLPVRSHHGNLTHLSESLGKGQDAGSMDSVIIGYEYFHGATGFPLHSIRDKKAPCATGYRNS